MCFGLSIKSLRLVFIPRQSKNPAGPERREQMPRYIAIFPLLCHASCLSIDVVTRLLTQYFDISHRGTATKTAYQPSSYVLNYLLALVTSASYLFIYGN